MKRSKIRLSIVSAMMSVSLLGLTGIGVVDGLSQLQRQPHRRQLVLLS